MIDLFAFAALMQTDAQSDENSICANSLPSLGGDNDAKDNIAEVCVY